MAASRLAAPHASAPGSEATVRPVPKVACGERGIRTVVASHLIRGPASSRRRDTCRVEWLRAGKIEPRRDHDQLARDGSERAVCVPEGLQMTEEASPFVWKGTLALARTGDRTFEEFFKHGRTPLMGIRPFSPSTPDIQFPLPRNRGDFPTGPRRRTIARPTGARRCHLPVHRARPRERDSSASSHDRTRPPGSRP